MLLSACSGGVANETPTASAEEPVEALVDPSAPEDENQSEDTSMATDDKEVEAVVEETATGSSVEASQDTKEEVKEESEEEATEEVSGFPERDKKIPAYELSMRDGSTIKLDQFEGQVVMMTFFTTW